MNKLLLISAIFFITSCGPYKPKYVIISKNYAPIDKPIPKGVCEFWYDDISISYNSAIPFQDSCNKYNVFDTLISKQNK